MEQLTKTQELVRVVDEDEMRVILMGERPDGSLELEERTDGKLTFAAFGSLTCVRKVVLAASACTREEVASFFAEGEPFLSDFQDSLDAKGIPYSFAMTTGNDIALRSATRD